MPLQDISGAHPEQSFAEAKTCLFDALRSAGFVSAHAYFDGRDGCGSITHIRARRHVGPDIDALALRSYKLRGRANLGVLLEAFTWHLVGAYRPGCLDADGAVGSVDVDLLSNCVTLRHAQRITQTFETVLRI